MRILLADGSFSFGWSVVGDFDVGRTAGCLSVARRPTLETLDLRSPSECSFSGSPSWRHVVIRIDTS